MNFFLNICIFIFILSMPSVIFAGKAILPPNDDLYMLGIDLGVGNPAHLGNSTQFKLGYSTFTYQPRHDSSWPFYGGLSINKNLVIMPSYTLQFGLSYHYFSPMKVSGNLSQGITPPHYQANYFYSISSSQLLAEAILRQPWKRCFSSYLIFGLGVSLNHAQNFSTSVPPYLTLTPSFSNNTTRSFSYALGLGFDYLIDPKLTLGISYRFMELGNAGLGAGKIRNTQLSEKLKQSNLYVNALAIHLNYFI